MLYNQIDIKQLWKDVIWDRIQAQRASMDKLADTCGGNKAFDGLTPPPSTQSNIITDPNNDWNNVATRPITLGGTLIGATNATNTTAINTMLTNCQCMYDDMLHQIETLMNVYIGLQNGVTKKARCEAIKSLRIASKAQIDNFNTDILINGTTATNNFKGICTAINSDINISLTSCDTSNNLQTINTSCRSNIEDLIIATMPPYVDPASGTQTPIDSTNIDEYCNSKNYMGASNMLDGVPDITTLALE